MSTIRWTEDGHDRAARWHSESDATAPSPAGEPEETEE